MINHQAHPRRRVEARKAEPKPDLGSFLDGVASVFGFPVAKPPQQTLTSYRYVTLEPTFTGPIGGYSTAVDPDTAIPTATGGADTPKKTGPATLPSAIVAPTTTSDLASSLPVVGATEPAAVTSAAMTTVSPLAQTSAPMTASQPTAVSTQSSLSSSSTLAPSHGLAAGAQAGLAIGIILGVGALVSVLVFCFKRRKRNLEAQRLEDEKEYAPEAKLTTSYPSARSTKTMSTAPRLSLRPVTQFLPNLNNGNNNPNQSAQGNSFAMSTSPKNNLLSAKPQSSWERPMTSQSRNMDNPFGNHARIETPVNPFGNHAEIVDEKSSSTVTPSQSLNPDREAARNAAGFGLRRGASQRAIANPLDYTKPLPVLAIHPPSPTGTEFSLSSAAPGALPQSTSAAAIAAVGGPQNSSVHRVQLDFKPSMDDELELQAGQLIRLLHEYDDGWALCIRLDRSEQGVVPRTCLSTRPVKPRMSPQGPPGPPPAAMHASQPHSSSSAPNPNMSPTSKSGGRGSPSGPPPNMPLPQGPPSELPRGGPNSPPSGRPMNSANTPGNPSSQNPPSYGHERRVTPPNNVHLPGRMSPNGSPPFSVERKPLPGQT